MTFFPDGETDIPNQTPVPGIRDSQARPDQPAPGDPAASPRPGTDPEFSKKLVRMAIINGIVLLTAVLLAYIFPVTEDPAIQTGIVIGAAILCSIHTTVVVMSHQRRRQAQGATTTTRPRYGEPGPVREAQPYGAVQAGLAASSGFALTVEDVFTISGRGTVVTGRVASGMVQEGQVVVIQRDGATVAEVEVTGIEMFRKLSQVAQVGDNVGLLLRGVTRDDVQRGDVIAA